MNRPVPPSRRGFTLVEVLVAVVIIVVLAALIFPTFGKIRQIARARNCMSNMRQLGLAFDQYLNDNGERYPKAGQYQHWADGGHWVTGGQGGILVNYLSSDPAAGLAKSAANSGFKVNEGHEAYPERGALYNYVRSPGVFVCPEAEGADKKRLSYSMNCALALLSSTRIKAPTDIVVLVDETDTLNDGYFWATNDASSTDSLGKKHNGGGNLLFADGHVRFYRFSQLPLDWNSEGLALKTSLTNPVRFYDRAFGPKGAGIRGGDPPVNGIYSTDSCGNTIATPAPTPPPA